MLNSRDSPGSNQSEQAIAINNIQLFWWVPAKFLPRKSYSLQRVTDIFPHLIIATIHEMGLDLSNYRVGETEVQRGYVLPQGHTANAKAGSQWPPCYFYDVTWFVPVQIHQVQEGQVNGWAANW